MKRFKQKNNTYVILGIIKNYNFNKKKSYFISPTTIGIMILKISAKFKNQIYQITTIRIDLGLNPYLKIKSIIYKYLCLIINRSWIIKIDLY